MQRGVRRASDRSDDALVDREQTTRPGLRSASDATRTSDVMLLAPLSQPKRGALSRADAHGCFWAPRDARKQPRGIEAAAAGIFFMSESSSDPRSGVEAGSRGRVQMRQCSKRGFANLGAAWAARRSESSACASHQEGEQQRPRITGGQSDSQTDAESSHRALVDRGCTGLRESVRRGGIDAISHQQIHHRVFRQCPDHLNGSFRQARSQHIDGQRWPARTRTPIRGPRGLPNFDMLRCKVLAVRSRSSTALGRDRGKFSLSALHGRGPPARACDRFRVEGSGVPPKVVQQFRQYLLAMYHHKGGRKRHDGSRGMSWVDYPANVIPTRDGEVVRFRSARVKSTGREPRVVFTNGVWNDGQSHAASALALSEAIDADVLGVYNPSGTELTSHVRQQAAAALQVCAKIHISGAHERAERGFGVPSSRSPLAIAGHAGVVGPARALTRGAGVGDPLLTACLASGVIESVAHVDEMLYDVVVEAKWQWLITASGFESWWPLPRFLRHSIIESWLRGYPCAERIHALTERIGSRGRSAIVVCHSQGNFNVAIALMALALEHPSGALPVSVYALGSPVADWPAPGRFPLHIEYACDPIQLGSGAVSDVLQACSADSSMGHAFVEYYLKRSAWVEQLREEARGGS